MKELSKTFKIQAPTPVVYEYIRSLGGKTGQVISDFPSFGLKVMADTVIVDEPGVKIVYETKAYGATIQMEYGFSPEESGTVVNLKMTSSGITYSMNELKVMFYPYVLELFSMEWGFKKGKRYKIKTTASTAIDEGS